MHHNHDSLNTRNMTIVFSRYKTETSGCTKHGTREKGTGMTLRRQTLTHSLLDAENYQLILMEEK